MKVRLAQKLLIVLAVPVVFQLGFFAVLGSMLADLDRNQEFERTSTERLVLRDRLYVGVYQRLLLYAIYRATNNEVYREQSDQLGESMAQDLNRIHELIHDDPEQLEAFAGIARGFKAFSLMSFIIMNFDGDTHLSTILGGTLGMQGIRNGLEVNDADAAEQLIKVLTQNQEQAEDRLRSTTRAANQALIFGSIISMLATLACGTVFSLSIFERLKKVLRNIHAMEKRQPIMEVRDRANDEITQLDCMVAETAKQIRAAEDFQSQTTQLVAQELEHPLQEIGDSFVQLRSDGFDELNTKGSDRLGQIDSEISRLRALVEDLLILDDMREAGFEVHTRAIDLAEVAEQAASAVREFAAARNISIVVNKQSVVVQADAERLVQVAVNLLSNAIKFSRDGDSIELNIDLEEGCGKLSVVDHGVGIAEEFRSRIFARFEQTSEGSKRKDSSGLGLAICKKLIEAQSGQMGFESEVGKGSTFWFMVPWAVGGDNAVVDREATVNAAERKWKPRLRQQIIALIALPLLVQILSAVALSYALNSSRMNLDELARTRKVVEIHTDVVRQIVRSTFYSMMFNVTQEQRDRGVATYEQFKLASLLAALNKVSSGDPALQREAAELKGMIGQIEKLQFEVITAKPDADIDRWFGPKTAAVNEKLLTQTMLPLERALEHQKQLLDERDASQGQMRRLLLIAMVLSFIASSGVSIGLGLFMVRKLTSKVDRVVANTVRLRERKPLAAPVEGDDELAFVDHAFHQAGNKLIELEKFKQEMVSVTSHELRTPLTSLLAFIELAESGIFGVVSQHGRESLQRAHRNASELIAMITNLLDTEKMQSGKVLVSGKKLVDSSEVVTAALSGVRGLIDDQQLTVSTNLPVASSMKADPERMAQALSAIFYDIAVRAKTDSAIEVSQFAEGEGVKLRIVASRLDEVEDHRARTQLCTNLASLIAQQHGGRFSAEKLDQDQIYSFELPTL